MKFAILGPESTGKSTLVEQLAKHFNGLEIAEYARSYLDGLKKPYELSDVLRIAEIQAELNNADSTVEMPVFADTEMTVIKIWCEVRFGHCPDKISDLLKRQHFDYYLLCNTDLPWTPDALREHSLQAQRDELLDRYRAVLENRKMPFTLISGQGQARFDRAFSVVENILHQ